MHSCIYEGIVRHSRHEPVSHQFQYPLFMLWLDLEELPRIVGRRGLIGASRHASRAFLRSDHLFNPQQPLAEEVRDIVKDKTGRRPTGPIRLLTQLRFFGWYFSPLNLFYVYDARDTEPTCVVAEVSNTPWNEKHAYVLSSANQLQDRALTYEHAKAFHVSPFMGMEQQYHWTLNRPGADLSVRLRNLQESREVFQAHMLLERRALDPKQLRRMTLRFPMMTARISLAIYHQALKLWWKKCPFYPHPRKRNRTNPRLNERAIGKR